MVEEKWWLLGDAETVKKNLQAQKDAAKSKVEKDRYMKALKALTAEKGK